MSVPQRDEPSLVMWRSWRAWELAAGCVAAGCLQSASGDARIRVQGTVALNGKAITKGTVLFAQVGGRDVASARLCAGGTFEVSLLPGDYGAAVRWYADERPTDDPNQVFTPKSLVPEKYTDTATSGLTVTVARGMPAVQLDLSP